MKAYAQLFSFKAELDPAVAAIAGNNMVALRGTRDLFDSWKKCRANIASEAQLKKLTKRQRRATMLKVPAAAFPPFPCHCLLRGSPGTHGSGPGLPHAFWRRAATAQTSVAAL